MKRKLFTLMSLLAVLLVVGLNSCNKDEMVVEKSSQIGLNDTYPIFFNQNFGGEEAECAALGEFMYAFKIDGWDEGDMNGDYLAEFIDGHSNLIEILNSDGLEFDFSATNSIGGLYVKGGSGGYGWVFDPQIYEGTGFYAPNNQGGQQAEVSHVTFCWNYVPDECEWYGETAWSAGNRYVNKGNWATYTPYVADEIVTLFAGRTLEAGTVHFSAQVDGYITITITLNAGWRFLDEEENVAVQDYEFAPSGNPAPGLFAHKGDADQSLAVFTIEVPLNNFYGVHVNVEWEDCPEEPME